MDGSRSQNQIVPGNLSLVCTSISMFNWALILEQDFCYAASVSEGFQITKDTIIDCFDGIPAGRICQCWSSPPRWARISSRPQIINSHVPGQGSSPSLT
jgi:hypothetical protein